MFRKITTSFLLVATLLVIASYGTPAHGQYVSGDPLIPSTPVSPVTGSNCAPDTRQIPYRGQLPTPTPTTIGATTSSVTGALQLSGSQDYMSFAQGYVRLLQAMLALQSGQTISESSLAPESGAGSGSASFTSLFNQAIGLLGGFSQGPISISPQTFGSVTAPIPSGSLSPVDYNTDCDYKPARAISHAGEAYGCPNLQMDLTVDPWVHGTPQYVGGVDLSLMAQRYGPYWQSGSPGPHTPDYAQFFQMGGCQPTQREIHDAYFAQDMIGAKYAGYKKCPACLATYGKPGVRWAGCDLGRTDWPFNCGN